MSVLMRRENTLIIEPGSDISKIQIINFILLPNSKKHFEGPPLYNYTNIRVKSYGLPYLKLKFDIPGAPQNYPLNISMTTTIKGLRGAHFSRTLYVDDDFDTDFKLTCSDLNETFANCSNIIISAQRDLSATITIIDGVDAQTFTVPLTYVNERNPNITNYVILFSVLLGIIVIAITGAVIYQRKRKNVKIIEQKDDLVKNVVPANFVIPVVQV
ncbi:Hypothetical_protein [Hexamita inflata]|uniref:Hypothetical_protein n=1 Tax=Hexamita inflata TaxID=28002 RepID=A0ABP1GGI1_9EUKA